VPVLSWTLNGGRRDAQAEAQRTRSKEDPWEAKARDRTRLRNEKQPKPLLDRHLAQARHVSEQPTSRPSPTSPDPQSQSLSRSYGSNLPTSLTYINLSTRGSSPWRPAADMGTSGRDTSTWPSPGFSRSIGTLWTPLQLRCSSRSFPYLHARWFQGTRTLIQKRKLFPELPTASPGPVRLPWRTPCEGPSNTVPLPGSGIGTRFPFAQRMGWNARLRPVKLWVRTADSAHWALTRVSPQSVSELS